jgi:hypothetical protein
MALIWYNATMKELIPCTNCQTAYILRHFGFSGKDELGCTQRGLVEQGDGCTFGVKGTPQIAVLWQDVNIGADAAKGGSWMW